MCHKQGNFAIEAGEEVKVVEMDPVEESDLEMVHLLERHLNERFIAHMNRFMPLWQFYREELNRAPLGHEAWEYWVVREGWLLEGKLTLVEARSLAQEISLWCLA